MSTDVVKFDSTESGSDQRIVRPKAVEFYLIVSLPLVVGVFVAWYGFYVWESRKERQAHQLVLKNSKDHSEKV